ncbi:hypothetical protein F2Q69_00008351 [Brassica cretica]|uniref:non-specific serine/threonine protein kinase n=1 Tax=Brassica cretica TaxID=69181 RepID=A0A8S9PDM7_BRACR|nr:hypothetical protein F2Q69_00008351 [Brassica cretica]
MGVVFSALVLFFTIITSFSSTLTTSASPALHPDELKALGEIATTLGIKKLNLSDGDPCLLKTLKLGVVSNPDSDVENIILCDCSFNNNMTCHIIELILKSVSLSGKLPPELAKLQHLQKINLCRNYLSGSIPMEWASMPNLTSISFCANRLSGPLPPGLQNFKSLKFLGVEANQFSGPIPDELGNMINLTGLELASNQFTGSLPSSLARLVNLEKFRISENNFSGTIPEYIGNWSRLTRLDLQASGLKGPFPDAVARLENLTNLFISDMTGINSFPNISSQAIKDLVLRNVSMSGNIPSYIWRKPNLRSLDLSFNKLTGEVLGINPVPKFTYLTGNMLSGEIKSGVYLNSRSNIDLSYNNFSLPFSCQERSNINTYRSSSLKNTLTGLLPCAGPITCKHYKRSLHRNCGGETVTVTNSIGKITYQADNSDQVKAATNQHFKNWGISNTGDFMDDNRDEDTYIISTSLTLPGDSPDLYKTARRSALSLVYYAFCLENGEYNLKLHFMEIQFSDQELYSRLGRRIFDVYVQGKLFLRDFNIRQEANGTLKSIVKELKAVNVTDHKLEIWLYWAGKGTTLIPKRGNYGPLISAISLCHSLEQHCGVEKTKHHINYPLIFGVTGPLVAIIFLALGFYAHRKFRQDKKKKERDLRARGLQTVCFTWRQLQAATNDFDEANKLGEGALSYRSGLLPCAGPINCTSYQRTVHINCGGENIIVTNSSHNITYQADNSATKAATNHQFKDWGISNTALYGDTPDLYKTARRSALSLSYYASCLENGAYSVKLYFMEIQLSDRELYNRFFRRIFDVYVQGELFLKDFNIKQEADGTLKPVVKELKAVNVTDHTLEIQLYWAGKGTTLKPKRGSYGPLISAISFCHSREPCGLDAKEETQPSTAKNLRAQGLQTVCFTWRQLQAATNDFDQANKLGEGGFGSVFKGELPDGTIIAVKQLSTKSCQGNREFVNEIGMISGLNHPNLVKLYGCCVEKDQLLLLVKHPPLPHFQPGGYMAPEYALMGHLTEKADVYSFGVVAMEIVSGKSNTTQKGSDDNAPLIKWAMTLQQKGDIMEIVDPKLEGEFNSLEAERMIKVALVCTNATPSLRPLMSEAVKMLEGEMEIPQIMSGPAVYGHDLNFSKLMEMQESTSMSGYGLSPFNQESATSNSTAEFSS